MEKQTQDIGPWYKQTWLWFVLTPLIAVVIYASIFMYIAITTSDGVVRDDYYKIARGMNVDTSRVEAAAKLGINGDILIDTLTGDIRLNLSAYTPLPSELILDLIHPTHQKYDQSITLRAVSQNSGVYLGALQSHLEGKRYLMLSDSSHSWHIRREINPPFEQNSFSLGADQ